MRTDFDVIVVGGGLAGLAAGATAAMGGASTVVLEAHQPGGRARVTERSGFVFNNGIHALFTGGPGATVLRTLGIQPKGAAPPMDRYMLLAEGTQHVLPVGPDAFAATTYLDSSDKSQLARLLPQMALVDPARLAGQSVSDWLAEQGLRPRVEALLRALFRLSTYAADLDRFGADAALAQQQVAARSGVLYLDGGWAQLVDALRSRVEVRSGIAIRSVDSDHTRAVVSTDDGSLTAAAVVVAVGTPDAARGILAAEPGWGQLSEPVTAACLDVGVTGVPTPGYVVSLDDPLYGTVQSPPARQSPPGCSVVGIIRYGARSIEQDRPQLEAFMTQLGVRDEAVLTRRFMARMTVTGTMPTAATGGLHGRPVVTATTLPRVFIAGDWVGPEGLLSDAALASGHRAARAALRLDRGRASLTSNPQSRSEVPAHSR